MTFLIGDTTMVVSPVLILGGALVVVLIVIALLISTLRRAGRSADLIAPLAQNIGTLGQRVQGLYDGQQQLSGGLTAVSDAQAASQANMLKLMEQRYLRHLMQRHGDDKDNVARIAGISLRSLYRKLQEIDGPG